MALSDYLTPEQLEIMLNETYGDQQTQDFIRPNPLQFQYPYIPGGIMNTGSQGLDTSRFTGVDLEPGYLDRAGSSDQDIYAEQEKQKGGGIGGLFRFLLGLAVPGSGLFMGDTSALQGIRNLNQRLRNTDFGQSRTLADYFDARRYGGRDARDAAAARNMAQARGITKSLASRPSSTSGGYQQGPGGSGAQSTGASNSQSQAGPGFDDVSEAGSF